MDKIQSRYKTLTKFKLNESEIEELLTYNENKFKQNSNINDFISFPLKSEPHVKIWQNYKTLADKIGTNNSLTFPLVQLKFPVQEGMSQNEQYLRAVRKGECEENFRFEGGLQLTDPDNLQLEIKDTLAGAIPVIIAPNRQDFELLIQAITKKNEPATIPPSMGACIIGGYNNWDRIKQYRLEWEKNNPNHCTQEDWNQEFKRLIPQKSLYQDRFIILSQGFYSNVSATQLGLTEQQWQKLSLTIRLEHECTHYFTRRVLNYMGNNLLDELIADYQGIVAALGYFRADWFLHFIGLESFPDYRQGGRLENYRGVPPLSDQAFKILQNLVKTAAENLEKFHNKYFDSTPTEEESISLLMALTTLTLEELASNDFETLVQESINYQKKFFKIE
ncbi:DUF7005 family protein [Cyanobacterium sp. DS4]|uniref:DUF7005 family protein n=1 Tax=Cyanobacterium sp. DS4 TaxID=2878255 RepID=UPI002E7FEBFD|nr:hypothetical protein [Cyanobacterium sp. Dongsha4]WVK99410.1 hypothetical protein Dongsha4_12040 [Cyanobacterium sp. Dongsha4]